MTDMHWISNRHTSALVAQCTLHVRPRSPLPTSANVVCMFLASRQGPSEPFPTLSGHMTVELGWRYLEMSEAEPMERGVACLLILVLLPLLGTTPDCLICLVLQSFVNCGVVDFLPT